MMKLVTIIALLALAVPVLAQGPPPQIPPDVQAIQQQLGEVGCSAERLTAAQTIVAMKKQIDDLQRQLNAKDPPPRSGATKH